MRIIISVFVMLLLMLPACAGKFDTGPGFEAFGNHFSEAMRWKDFAGAAGYLQNDVRGQFKDLFPEDDDLHIVESQIAGVDIDAQDGSVVADYRLEYYRLPSTRVKKWQWAQRWEMYQPQGIKKSVWQIINAPPPLL